MVTTDDLQRAHDAAISLLDLTQTVMGTSDMSYALECGPPGHERPGATGWYAAVKALPGRLAESEAIIGPVLGLHAPEHTEPVACSGVAGQSAHEVVLELARVPVDFVRQFSALAGRDVFTVPDGPVLLKVCDCLRKGLGKIPVGRYDPAEWNALRVRLDLELRAAEKALSAAAVETTAEPASEAKGDVAHSDDYRSVRWFGTTYTFTPTQAACVKYMLEQYERGTPQTGEQTILVAADCTGNRLRDVFRRGKHPAWGTMIVSVGKGLFGLAPEKS